MHSATEYFFYKLFDGKRDGHTNYPEGRERTCPEDRGNSAHGKRPFESEYEIQKKAAPGRYLYDRCDHKQKQDGLPVFTFADYPHYEANKLSFEPVQPFFCFIHFSSGSKI